MSTSFQINGHHNLRVIDGGHNCCELQARSPFTGTINSLFVAGVTYADMVQRITEWQGSRQLIQNVFPDLTADEREFLMTGITAEEWDTHLSPADE